MVSALGLAVDLGRAFLGGSPPAVQIAPPFKGEWLVAQGRENSLLNQDVVS